eukprot:TRINITY_DN1472_c0_g1_i7.p1 TRINITY_DN1472_c0_g1~~TRINITY_DN1472_c0_g1_i7.p1  ORF type:complete len:391 (+),score=81.72 TRINITY_DN1472_c0_g1_i7:59-1231(+)
MASTHLMKRSAAQSTSQNASPAVAAIPQESHTQIAVPPHELPEWTGSDELPEKAASFEFTHGVTGDFKSDYETVCGILNVAMHPSLLRTFQLRKEKLLAMAENAEDTSAAGRDVISELSFRGVKVDRVTSFVLSHVLKANTNVSKISLFRNFLQNDSLEHILAAAGACQSVHSIALDWNESADIVDHLAPFLSSPSCRLKSVSLRANNISDQHAAKLADVLKANTSLVSLSLFHNQIGDHGAAALADALVSNKSLLSLNLSENLITTNGARALAEALSRIPLPEDVSEQLTKKKAEMEAEMAKNKKKPVEKDPKKAAKKPVKKDEAPKELDLESNECVEGKWYRKGNRTLVSLNLSRNPIGIHGESLLHEVRVSNEVIQMLALLYLVQLL